MSGQSESRSGFWNFADNKATGVVLLLCRLPLLLMLLLTHHIASLPLSPVRTLIASVIG